MTHNYSKIMNTVVSNSNQTKVITDGLPAAAASSWSGSINNSQATGIMSAKTSSDKMAAALVITASGVCIRFSTYHQPDSK